MPFTTYAVYKETDMAFKKTGKEEMPTGKVPAKKGKKNPFFPKNGKKVPPKGKGKC
jgi:hypothetical protein